MDVFTAFLPRDRRRAVLLGDDLPNRVHGTALFADISAFTPLTAKLAEELGQHQGAEELIRQLNRVYSALIDTVHAWGGDVINFSGDAITCWFDEGPDTELGLSAHWAAACSVELQATMARLREITTPGGAIIPLGVKVALASGPARRFLVGDPANYVIEVLAGATLDRMASAEKHAERGEIVMTQEVVGYLGASVTVHTWRAGEQEQFAVLATLGAQTPPSPDPKISLPPETARPWLLPPVYERLRLSPHEFLADLRPSVALFVKFAGIDYDVDDDAGRKLDRFACRAQTIVSRYEGYLLQLTMGDKGSYLYVSFGAPIAHEDDAVRAAAAALELRAAVVDSGFEKPPQIGISQGLAHSGAYGGPDRRTFGVIGSDVNIAARLMTAAQAGQILVSGHVAAAADALFSFATLPPMHLKGVAELFYPLALQARRRTRGVVTSHEQTAAMVGREHEREIVHESLAALLAGQSGTVVIEGDPGIGKSLLATELMDRAETMSSGKVVTLSGSGDAIEQTTPYRAWQSIVERIFAPEDEEGIQVTVNAQAVFARTDPSLHPFASLLAAVLPVDIPPTELTEQITGEARQDLTHQLLINALANYVAPRPLLLVVDDAQWLDSVSWTLIRRVSREVQPLLLLLVTRPLGADAPGEFRELRDLPATRLLVLDRLPPQAIETLVCRRLGARRLPPAIAQLIHAKAEGNPFFSEELALALRDAGIMEIVGGEVSLVASASDLQALEFPNTIQGIITSRIDRLPPSLQLTVKVASVIGRVFAFRVLYGVYPVRDAVDELRHNLERLARLDITPMETPEPDLAYIFRQIVTQEVVYGLMTFAQRRQLHYGAAVWYEADAENSANPSYPLLAYHWRQAGDAVKAATYFGLAGENAFRDYANREAIAFLSQALALDAGHRPALQRARWRRLSGEAAYRLTLMEQSQRDYEGALTLLERPIPNSAIARALALGDQVLRQVIHRQLPQRFVGRAPVEEREALLEAARAYEGVSEYYYNVGDFLATFYCVMTAFNLAERAGPSPELARGYANMCATLATVAMRGPAENYRHRAVEMAAEVDDLGTRAWIRIPLSTYSLWIGAWDRAEAEIGEALDIYSRLGEWRRWGVAAWLWPQVAQCRGEPERAGELWSELLAVATRSQDTRHQVRSLGGRFFNALSLAQIEDAHASADATRVILDENPEMAPVEERLWLGMRARRALLEGQWTFARDLVHEQIAAFDRARFKFDLLDVFATPVEVQLALWERGEATADEARAGLKVLQGYARTYAFARPRALRNGGQLAWLAGDHRRAHKLWQKSLTTAESLMMPLEKALTQQMIEHTAP